MAAFRNYHWPGNVRELENVVERLVAINSQNTISVEDLPLDLVSVRDTEVDEMFTSGASLRQATAEFQRHYILKVLEKSRWNQREAAKRLGVHRNTLIGKMESLHIREAANAEAIGAQDIR
jgi:DNA-binding NtrC family response regulator